MCVLQAGMMVTINSTKDLSVSVGRFYLPLNKSAPESPIFSLPYMDMADQSKSYYNYIYLISFFFYRILIINDVMTFFLKNA